MKIFITGGTGFVGRHLVEYWKQSGHSIVVVARHIDASLLDEKVHCLEVDITSRLEIEKAIFSVQPDVLIHTAAMSKPNDCEENQEHCFATNVSATKNIAAACKTIGAKLIFCSTDFVFDKNGPYSETDACEPVNYYGQSKQLAEEAIQASGVLYAIVRTGLVVGPKLKGQANTFLHWVKDSLEAGKTIQLYIDQQRSPTFVTDLCSGINAVIKDNFNGTIHLSGSDVFSPYSLAQKVAEYWHFSQQLLLPVTAAQRPEIARRPQNAVLNTALAKRVLTYSPTSFAKIMKAVFTR